MPCKGPCYVRQVVYAEAPADAELKEEVGLLPQRRRDGSQRVLEMGQPCRLYA